MNKKIIILTFLLLGCLLVGSSVLYLSKTHQNTRKTIKILAPVWPGFMPMILARELGYFKDEGVEVDYSFSSNSKQILMDFEAGSYDGVFWNLSAFLPLQNSKNIRFILASDSSTTGDAILAYPPITSPKDLKGKRISAIHGGYGELFVISMLNKHGLREGDVTWIILSNENEGLDQLIKKKIDAIHIWEPYVSKGIKAGANTIFTASDLPGLILDGLAVHERVLEEKREEIKAFMRAWFRAVDFWLAHKEEGSAIVARVLKIPRDEVQLKGLKLYNLKDNIETMKRREDFSSAYYVGKVSSDFYLQKSIMLRPAEIDLIVAPALIEDLSKNVK